MSEPRAIVILEGALRALDNYDDNALRWNANKVDQRRFALATLKELYEVASDLGAQAVSNEDEHLNPVSFGLRATHEAIAAAVKRVEKGA